MKLRIGYQLDYEFPQPTPIILVLNVHHSRVSDLQTPDHVIVSPSVSVSGYRDGFGNWCKRLVAPAGAMRISSNSIVNDTGMSDPVVPDAVQVPIETLPEEALVFLLASRFCDSDQMLDLAWTHFGYGATGWARVQAICDFVHRHIAFGYEHARVTRTASEAYRERQGVCRDYRAAIVMSWNLAFDHLLAWIFKDPQKLAAFNNTIPVRYPKAKVSAVTTREGFEDIKEAEIIEITYSANLISKNVTEILRENLKRRNRAAHPSQVVIVQSQADDLITNLINNIVLSLT